MTPIETIELKDGQTLEIYDDLDSESPREWDNLATLICFHGRYKLGDDHNLRTEDYESFSEMILETTADDDVVLPLYLYDHSLLSMSTEPFYCRWDSGQVGFAVISKETMIKEFGYFDSLKALDFIKSEVAVYNDYLQGNVYGYILNDENGDQLDSCWGFYGYDHDKNGLFETAGVNKKDVA